MIQKFGAKLFVGLLTLLAFGLMPTRLVAEDLTIFAASSLTELTEKLAADFEAQTGQEIRVVTGASSSLARQIEKGAPASVFISANRDWADYVTARSAFAPAEPMLGNTLVLASAKAFDVSLELSDFPQLLGSGRLAIGDPAHVPAGQYAQTALEAAGVWSGLENQLIPAVDVRSALAFVRQGAAQFGIVYASDVFGTSLAHVGLDPALYGAVTYYLVAPQDRSAQNSDLVDFLLGPRAEVVFVKMGFVTLRD